MKTTNLHKLYYKDYFDFESKQFKYIFESSPKGDKSLVEKKNESLTSTDFSDKTKKEGKDTFIPFVIPNNCCNKDHSFQLKISYPGLVTGVGINHEAKIEGEFKLGVHFDWTYGIPVVYGSSVKGVLRNAFKDGYVDASLIAQANAKDGICKDAEVPTWVADESNRKAIIDGIFEGKDSNGKNLSIYDRDVFFDAVIVTADYKGRILVSDSITPHGDNPLKNPTPITFLKIAPGCKLEFRFKLHDSDFGGGKTFTAAQKIILFEEILKTVGVGAKTNVGYGQLKL